MRASFDFHNCLTWCFATPFSGCDRCEGAETLITRDFVQNKVHRSAQECRFNRFAAIVIGGKQGLLSCKAMELIFSHTTALRLLRTWSRSHPLTVRAFHGLGMRDVGHLPSSRLRGFSSLARTADTEAAVRRTIEGVKKPSLKSMLEELWGSAAPESPLHVLAQPKEGRHPTKRVRFHQLAASLPRGTFLEIAPGVAVCSPELIFVQMAETLSLGELVALGYELCGCYPLDADQPSALVRAPLTTPGRLTSFVGRAHRIKGLRKACIAAQFVNGKSASVKETEMDALFMMPMRWGGLGLPPALANEPVALSEEAARIARGNQVVCDLLWPQVRVAAEYDGRAWHAERHRQVRDSRRRDALLADGFDVVTVTSSQIDSVSEFIEIADILSRKTRGRTLARPASFLDRHLQLRQGLRAFHHRHFPPDSMSVSDI